MLSGFRQCKVNALLTIDLLSSDNMYIFLPHTLTFSCGKISCGYTSSKTKTITASWWRLKPTVRNVIRCT